MRAAFWLNSAWVLLVLFQTPMAEAMSFEALRCIVIFTQHEKLLEKKQKELAALFLDLKDPSVIPIHPSRKIRNGLYKVFRKHLNLDSRIMDDLLKTDFNDIPKLLNALKKMGHHDQSKILENMAEWLAFRSQVLDELDAGYHYIDGKKVFESFYQDAMALQSDLEKKGIQSKFVPGRTENNSPEGFGFLVITGVDPKFLSPGIGARKEILKSEEFQKYLDIVQREQGVIAIDPTLLSMSVSASAYFGENNAIAGTRFVLAIRPDTNGATFVHEWEHKVDVIDKKNQLPGQVFRKNKAIRKTALGRAFHRTGAYLEDQYLSELNATAKEYELYFENKEFPFLSVVNTIIYRSSNQRKVAVGRIFMEPTNPKHYILYLRGGAKFVIPAAIAVRTWLAILNALTSEEDGEEEDSTNKVSP